MQLMRRVSVRWRLTIVAAGAFAIALAVASFVLVRSVHNNLVASIRQTDRQELAQLASQLEDGTPPGQLGFDRRPDRGMPLIVVTTSDGRRFVIGLPGYHYRPNDWSGGGG